MKRTVHGQYVAVYARVSTEDQVREGVSLSAQVARLKAYCEAVRPGGEVCVVVDEAVSAKSRPSRIERTLSGLQCAPRQRSSGSETGPPNALPARPCRPVGTVRKVERRALFAQ